MTEIEDKAIALATQRTQNGWTWPKNDLEVDAEAATSAGEHGVWVRCWVLVTTEDLEEQA